jgi:hypothetical protein
MESLEVYIPFDQRQGDKMALQTMALGAAISTELALIGTFAREVGQRLGAALAERAPGTFDPYRPELHYMRGPGPKWREKHGRRGAMLNVPMRGAAHA